MIAIDNRTQAEEERNPEHDKSDSGNHRPIGPDTQLRSISKARHFNNLTFGRLNSIYNARILSFNLRILHQRVKLVVLALLKLFKDPRRHSKIWNQNIIQFKDDLNVIREALEYPDIVEATRKL
ncbi:hypothetical protein D3C81_1424100 [compost metagenome]